MWQQSTVITICETAEVMGKLMKCHHNAVRNILFLTTVIPDHRTTGGEVASQTVIDALRSLGINVHVVGYSRVGQRLSLSPNSTIVDERPIETSSAGLTPLFWAFFSILARLPYTSAKYHSRAYISLVRKLLSDRKYNLIIVDHAQMAWTTRYFPKSSKVIFIAHNIEHQNYLYLSSSKKPLLKRFYLREAEKIKISELECAKTADQTWVLNSNDAEYFQELAAGSRVKTLSLPCSNEANQTCEYMKKYDVALIGSWNWSFNRESLKWFLEKVLPKLSEKTSVHIAGSGSSWVESTCSRVHVSGFVKDPLQFMSQARVIAIPTLGGTGIQVKFLSSLLTATEIVATSEAVRDIDSIPCGVSIADDPEEFSKIITETLKKKIDKKRDAFILAERASWMKRRKNDFTNTLQSTLREVEC